MKIYYITQDLKPTDNLHYVESVSQGVIVPDMSTLMAIKGQIVSGQFAKMCKEEYGRTSVSYFEVPNMYGKEYNSQVRKEYSDSGSITMFYTGI